MGHGCESIYTVSMVSGNSLSSAIDLGRVYASVYMQISSVPSNSEHRIYAAESMAGVFSVVCHPAINSSTVAVNAYVIPSGITGAIVPIPGGFRYLKIFASAAMDNVATYKIYGCDE